VSTTEDLAVGSPPRRQWLATRVPRLGPGVLGGRSTAARGVVGVVALAAVVQAFSWWGPRQWQVPGLAALMREVVTLCSGSDFVAAVGLTLQSLLVALLVATAAGVGVGVLLGLSRTVSGALTLPLELIRPIPAIALIPLVILALGQGQQMAITVTAIGCWWPLLFNTLYGVRTVEPVTVQTARVFGLGRFATIWRVILPASLPTIVTGLRIAAPLALIITVGAEYIATTGQGLGGVLVVATSSGQLNVLWAAAVITGIMGMLLGGMVSLLGRVACPWARS